MGRPAPPGAPARTHGPVATSLPGGPAPFPAASRPLSRGLSRPLHLATAPRCTRVGPSRGQAGRRMPPTGMRRPEQGPGASTLPSLLGPTASERGDGSSACDASASGPAFARLANPISDARTSRRSDDLHRHRAPALKPVPPPSAPQPPRRDARGACRRTTGRSVGAFEPRSGCTAAPNLLGPATIGRTTILVEAVPRPPGRGLDAPRSGAFGSPRRADDPPARCPPAFEPGPPAGSGLRACATGRSGGPMTMPCPPSRPWSRRGRRPGAAPR